MLLNTEQLTLNINKENSMPYGKGTYGSKVGRPKAKKVMKKKPVKKVMKRRK